MLNIEQATQNCDTDFNIDFSYNLKLKTCCNFLCYTNTEKCFVNWTNNFTKNIKWKLHWAIETQTTELYQIKKKKKKKENERKQMKTKTNQQPELGFEDTQTYWYNK